MNNFNKIFLRWGHHDSKSVFPTVVNLQYVKNIGAPTCLDCIYFVPSKYENAPDLSKCSKFAKQEYSSGNIQLEWADVMRISYHHCGPYAKYKETNKSNYIQITRKIPYTETEK